MGSSEVIPLRPALGPWGDGRCEVRPELPAEDHVEAEGRSRQAVAGPQPNPVRSTPIERSSPRHGIATALTRHRCGMFLGMIGPMQWASLVAQGGWQAKNFDVICAGEALWKLTPRRGRFSSKPPRVSPCGGPMTVALALARQGLRVGLATVLADDTFGRDNAERIAAAGVDVGGVTFARPGKGFVLIDGSGGANQVPSDAEEEPPLEVPSGWSSQVLLLSGLSPVVSHAAALCKAARAARREGSFVLIDFNASLHVWAGRDPRTIRMLLREVDAARCSLADLAVLDMDVATVRAALRSGAVLVVSDGGGGAVATGSFGDVCFVPPQGTRLRTTGPGDACTAAICAELTRHAEPGESASARWFRAFERGHASASTTA
jgi:2-dehydro-3-deoxygluconokinase